MSTTRILPAALASIALSLPLVAQSPLCVPSAPPWASNNGGATNVTAQFDLAVSVGVLVNQIDVNLTATAGTAVNLEVWTTPTTYIGNELNPAAWTLAATDVGGATAAGRESPTAFTLTAPLRLSPGSYGVGIRVLNTGQAYNGTGSGETPLTVSNNELSLTSGAVTAGLFTGTLWSVRHWNGCFHYTPAAGLYPSFTATPETGPSPLQVQFTDTTFTSDPNGVQNWAWDVDGDGNTDYNVQNPRHTYAAGGTYDVRLDVTDTMHGTRRLTRTGFIVVDPISCSFTATPTLGTAPLAVQFTDTTTGNPTAWLWDFENDGTIDSTVQNPLFTYASGGRYTVKLSVTNGANVDSLTVTDMITVVGGTNNTNGAELLEFNFNEPRGSTVANTASTNLAPAHATVGLTGTPNAAWQGDPGRNLWKGNEAGAGCMAADNVTPYEARVDTGWPVDIVGSHTIMFWTRIQTVTSYGYAFGSTLGSGRCYHDGTHWSLRSWGSLGTTYPLSGTDPMTLTGWNHWAVVIDDAAGSTQWYLNGVADGAPVTYTPNTFVMQNTFGNFTIGGYSTSSTFGRYADIDDFRVYGNALNVSQIIATMASENAATGTFGDGCQGPATTPQIGALGGPPTIGSATFQVVTDSLEPGVPQVINFGLWTSQGGLLPFDLSTILGANYTGCLAEIAPDLGAFILGGATGAAIPLPLPNDPTLGGAHVYAQTVVLGSQGAVSPALDINVQN